MTTNEWFLVGYAATMVVILVGCWAWRRGFKAGDRRKRGMLDRDCERIVRPTDYDFMAGHRDGYRGYSPKTNATRWYRKGYWHGRFSRENKWLATFGEGAAD